MNSKIQYNGDFLRLDQKHIYKQILYNILNLNI